MTTTIKPSNKTTTAVTGVSKDTSKNGSATKNKETKYSDKSAGQPGLVKIFDAIKAMMKPYAKGAIKERDEKPGIYSLVSEKQIEAAGRRFDEIYFAGIIVQKG